MNVNKNQIKVVIGDKDEIENNDMNKNEIKRKDQNIEMECINKDQQMKPNMDNNINIKS